MEDDIIMQGIIGEAVTRWKVADLLEVAGVDRDENDRPFFDVMIVSESTREEAGRG